MNTVEVTDPRTGKPGWAWLCGCGCPRSSEMGLIEYEEDSGSVKRGDLGLVHLNCIRDRSVEEDA